MSAPLRVLVAGCGNMGASHARAYQRVPGFEIVGLVSRGPEKRERLSQELLASDEVCADLASRPVASRR